MIRRCENARRTQSALPQRTRTYHELDYAANSWPQAFRVVLKTEAMSLGENPHYVVTSLALPTPENLYRDLYCARAG
jgi:Transposase DDE domain group 1